MAASISSSINLLKRPACAVAPANEEQCTPGLVVQPVTLGAPRGNEGPAQQEPAQEQTQVRLVSAHGTCLVDRAPQWKERTPHVHVVPGCPQYE